MKFGKEFSSQLVQEWQGAYLDYNQLKKLLKNIIRQNAPSPRNGFRMYRAFSGLTGPTNSPRRLQHQNHYETTFLRPSEEHEAVFFKKLDAEFNKVLRFYEARVEGVKQEAEELSKQMNALIALRIKVDDMLPPYAQAQLFNVVSSTMDRENHGLHMDVIQEIEMNGSVEEEKTADEDVIDLKDFRLSPVELLNHVKIKVDPDTPISTLRNVMKCSKSGTSVSKDKLTRAEAKLRKAFVEFYHQLRLLKNYSFFNMLAFSKIMKKYDKITSRNASKTYLDIVEKSSLGSCDEVNILMGRLETTFIKHFADGNRRKGMKSLRPRDKKERHRTTFFLGLFTGCSIALVAAIIVSIHARNLLGHEGGPQYMNNIFPLYSLFGYICLHMIMYGANTYFWRRLRVNYPFIFGTKPGRELGFREIFLVASGLSVLTLAAILSNLDLEMDPKTERYQMLTELVPLGLVAVVLLIIFCPLNIIYRSSRFLLIRRTWRCILAPLYKVTFMDFFLADQLTSQIQAIRSLQFYVCYYAWGDFRKRSNKCLDSDTYKSLYIVVAVIPFWLRVLQCLRRVFEEKNAMQGLNSLKYFSTVIALVMRTMYDLSRQSEGRTLWRIMAASTSGITTIYNTYWDIVIDWGLLQKNSKNRWLRDKLLISSKSVYALAIVVNILLRLVWMQLVLDFNLPFLHRNAMITLVACLEILRRGIWNFFRLENEHFNNVENYRAFRPIPLPFYYEDDKIM